MAPDNRPLCEYGSACYRKNPQHRLDYRHDGPSGRKARPGISSSVVELRIDAKLRAMYYL